jgi:hypothetical protein
VQPDGVLRAADAVSLEDISDVAVG